MEREGLILIFIILSLALGIATLIAFVLKKPSVTGDDVKEIKKENAELLVRLESSEKVLGGLIAQSRADSERQNEFLRREMRESYGKVFELIEKNNRESYEMRAKSIETISKGLSDIGKSNSEYMEKQGAVLDNALSRMQKSNEEKLEKMRQTVDEKLDETLSTRLDASFKAVSEQLGNLYKSLGEMKELSSGVTDNVTSLNRILSNVKIRGTWAEIQLEGILDQTIPGMYDKNVATVPGSSARVEFAVRIPSGENKNEFSYLPIDSKFPMEDYVRLCAAGDAGDEDGMRNARKELEKRVLACAKDISKYIHEPDTTPFAIMYLATEGLYSEIISSPGAIAERVHRDYNVMISGPSTVTALLNSLSMGFKAIAVNEKAKEVRVLLGAAKTQYEKFAELLSKARKKIDEAGHTLDDASGRNDIICKKLRGVEVFNGDLSDKILGIEE